jgi:hypothetical protein
MKIIDKTTIENKKLKSIELIHFISNGIYRNETLIKPVTTTHNIKTITLLHKGPHYDYIVLVNIDDNELCYLGKWNDGVSW